MTSELAAREVWELRAPGKAILSSIRRQVTGDGDVRIRDYVVDGVLRKIGKGANASTVADHAMEQLLRFHLVAPSDEGSDYAPAKSGGSSHIKGPVKIKKSRSWESDTQEYHHVDVIEFKAETIQEKEEWLTALAAIIPVVLPDQMHQQQEQEQLSVVPTGVV